MYPWLAIYFGGGLAVFLLLRVVCKKARLDPRPHDQIWIICLSTPEGWIIGIPFWPVLAVASVFWVAADFLHARGKIEISRAEELEAKRDKTYDGLDLMQKIERLKVEAEKRK